MTPGPASQIRFAADRMLGRLARTLRLLGYDTVYSPQITTPELEELARTSDRVVLTRGRVENRFAAETKALSLVSDSPPEQLREIIRRFGLDTQAGLWTRCTLCNSPIGRVEKAEIKSEVKPRVFELYEQFYRCSGCGHIYWQGSHTDRIRRNLQSLLG